MYVPKNEGYIDTVAKVSKWSNAETATASDFVCVQKFFASHKNWFCITVAGEENVSQSARFKMSKMHAMTQ